MQTQRTELDSLKTQMQEQNQVIADLKNALAKQQQNTATAHSALEDLREENQKILENRASLQATVTHLHTQLDDVKREQQQAVKAFAKERAELLTMREDDRRNHRTEIDAMRAKLDTEKHNHIIQAARVRDLEHQIPAMQAELKKITTESLRGRNEAQAAVGHAEEATVLAETKNKTLQQTLAERDRENGELKNEIKTLRQQEQLHLATLTDAVRKLGSKLDAGVAKSRAPKASTKKSTP